MVGMADKIVRFSGDYRFLSNFWVENDGTTIEHYFQASKTLEPEQADRVMAAKSPGEAKRLGRQVTLRPDWDEIKEQVMLNLLKQKFADPELRKKLLETGDKHLSEGNDWNDTYWGVNLETGEGKNRLGELLMQVRAEIRGGAA